MKRSIFLLLAFSLLGLAPMVLPNSAVAHHVMLGRWMTNNCGIGDEITLVEQNGKYAVIIAKDGKKIAMRSVAKRLQTENGGTNKIVYAEEGEEGILYEVLESKALMIRFQKDEQCTGTPLPTSGGIPLD